MVAVIRIEEPFRRPTEPARPAWSAFLSMAFRPFYLLAALHGIAAILAWSFGFSGTAALPGWLWHGHEMIWGYAGAVIVGFLLTAVATWTGQPPLRGATLAALALLWLTARILLVAMPDSALWGGTASALFFVASAVALALPIIRTRNQRNYIVPVILLAFAAANIAFHLGVAGEYAFDARRMLHAGLLIVAAVIFFMGLRVIAFFTSRALNIPQVMNPPMIAYVSISATLAMAASVAFDSPPALIAVLGLIGAVPNLRQLVRWWHRDVLSKPLLWVLFAGYLFAAEGVLLYGIGALFNPVLLSAAIHCIAVGGIGLLTLGMMSRTALGHTGRPLELPAPMGTAFMLLIVATIVRLLAAFMPTAHTVLIVISALCFAAGFSLFVFRFAPWLIRPRADGRP